MFRGQLCNVCADRITTEKVHGTEGRVLKVFYAPSTSDQKYGVTTSLGNGHGLSTTAAAAIQLKGDGEADAGGERGYRNESAIDIINNNNDNNRSTKSPPPAATGKGMRMRMRT